MTGNSNGKHSFIDPKVLARLSSLGLHARLPMLGSVSGRHRSPIRFVDMEGGEAIIADPGLMGKKYRRAISGYLDELRIVMRDAAVDYHRINLQDPVDDVLARFLVGRKPKKKGVQRR